PLHGSSGRWPAAGRPRYGSPRWITAGTLRLTVRDSASGKPTVARISLREDRGRFHAPAGSLHRSLRGRGHFYCDRTAELTVPAGTYRLSGYRGPEYKVTTRELIVKEGQTP